MVIVLLVAMKGRTISITMLQAIFAHLSTSENMTRQRKNIRIWQTWKNQHPQIGSPV